MGTHYSWHDLYAVCQYATSDTAIYRAVTGSDWTADTYLAAALVDQLRHQTWVIAKVNGGRGSKPKPIKRPERPDLKDGNKTFGKAADVDDIRTFLERKNGR